MKFRIQAVALSGAAALLLSGCTAAPGSSTEEPAESIKIVVAQYSANTQEYWEKIIAEFKADTPGVEVDLQVLDWGNLMPQVNNMIQTKQYPDILNVTNFADYATAGLLYKADEVLTPEVVSDFLPAFRDNASIDGAQYGLPFIASVNVMYYNVDLFEEAGIAEPPATFDDLLEQCEIFKKLPGDIVPYALSLGTEGGTGTAGTWLYSGGGAWNNDGEWVINSDTNIATMEYLQDLAEKGCTQPNPGQTNRGDGTWPLFAQGKAAMVYAPLGQVPGFMDPVKEAGLNVAATTHPTNGGADPVALTIQDNLMAFKKPGNKDHVADILARFYEADRYAGISKTEGLFATTKAALDIMLQDTDLELTQEDIDLLQNSRFEPTRVAGWPGANARIKSDIGLAVMSGADARQVLDAIQEVAEAG